MPEKLLKKQECFEYQKKKERVVEAKSVKHFSSIRKLEHLPLIQILLEFFVFNFFFLKNDDVANLTDETFVKCSKVIYLRKRSRSNYVFYITFQNNQ